jgi:hypothetical protein
LSVKRIVGLRTEHAANPNPPEISDIKQRINLDVSAQAQNEGHAVVTVSDGIVRIQWLQTDVMVKYVGI